MDFSNELERLGIKYSALSDDDVYQACCAAYEKINKSIISELLMPVITENGIEIIGYQSLTRKLNNLFLKYLKEELEKLAKPQA